MNERIKELYKKAHIPGTALDPSNDMKPYPTTLFSAEKFAELIIKECVNKCYTEDGQRILDHFGVE